MTKYKPGSPILKENLYVVKGAVYEPMTIPVKYCKRIWFRFVGSSFEKTVNTSLRYPPKLRS